MNLSAIITRAVKRTNYNTGRVLKEAGLNIDRFGSRLMNDVAYMAEMSRHRQLLPLYNSLVMKFFQLMIYF